MKAILKYRYIIMIYYICKILKDAVISNQLTIIITHTYSLLFTLHLHRVILNWNHGNKLNAYG